MRGPRAAAIDAARAGLRVFPVIPRGKKPLRRGWQRSATDDLAVVEATWRDVPDANVGVACGRGLVVVDTDSAEGDATVRAWDMPDTTTVKTAAGRHYYLSVSGRERNRTLLRPGVDIRGDGGYVVGAGSVHPSGAEYRWEIPPWELGPAPAPPELLALLANRRARVVNPSPSTIQRGTRNTTLFQLACSLRGRSGLSCAELVALLIEVNRGRCRPQLDVKEVERIAQSAASYARPPLWATDPLAFAIDPALGAPERLLLAAMARYSNDRGICWPGVRQLHADTGLATDTIERATRALVVAGRVEVTKRRGTSNLYRLFEQPERAVRPVRGEPSGSSVLPSRTVGGESP